jgi:hypothetical protein
LAIIILLVFFEQIGGFTHGLADKIKDVGSIVAAGKTIYGLGKAVYSTIAPIVETVGPMAAAVL